MNPTSDLNYYLIPGMGANKRLYENYKLPGNVHHLEWVHAEHAKTLADYAKFLARKITTQNNIIVGSSMGGMMAVELSHIVRPVLTVLISAPTGRHQFPKSLKILDAIGLHKRMKPKTMFKLTRLCNTFMGFKSPEQKSLFYQMMETNGPDFLHYSVNAVLGWKNTSPPHGPFVQILGDQDKLFSCDKIPNARILRGSGHFSTYEKATEICAIIAEETSKITGMS